MAKRYGWVPTRVALVGFGLALALAPASCSDSGGEDATVGSTDAGVPGVGELPSECGGASAAACAAQLAARPSSAGVAGELERLRARFRLTGPKGAWPAIGRGEVRLLEPSSRHAGALRAVVPIPALERGPWRYTAKPVSVELPLSASGMTRVIDDSGVEVGFQLRDAAAVAPQLGGGVVLYPSAYRGGHVVQRASFVGVEDYVLLEQPPAEDALHYQIDVSRVPGLRLDNSTLELLDRDGTPRLRMNAPYLVTEAGQRVSAQVEVQGCAYDTSPAPPWGRAVTAPGSATCEVVVRWSDATYPALVDPVWETASVGQSAHYDHDAALVPGTAGLIMAAGGTYDTGGGVTAQDNSELFDPASKTFSTKRNFNNVHLYGKLSFNDTFGYATMLGGDSSTPTIAPFIGKEAESYDPYAHVWVNVPSMNVERGRGMTAVSMASSPCQTVVAGGFGTADPGLYGIEYRRDTASSPYWFVVVSPDDTLVPKQGATATQLDDGSVVIIGGWDSSANPLAGGLRFVCPASATIGTTTVMAASMTEGRRDHTATLMPNGEVLVAGGDTGDPIIIGMRPSSNTYFYNRVTDSFTTGPSMNLARTGHAAAPLNGGRVLVVGGEGATSVAAGSAEMYWQGGWVRVTDPPAGNASLTSEWIHHTATATTDGNSVVVIGNEVLGDPNPSNWVRRAPIVFTLLGQGDPCTIAAECATNLCVDGVCCDSACDGLCEACSNAAAGQGSDGTCGPVADGLDPDNECTAGSPGNCGFDGACDGKRACGFYQGNACQGGATCNGNSAVGQYCDGLGTCVTDSTGVACDPYKCVVNQGCATSCAADTDCISAAYYCEQNTCQPKKLDGDPCQSANQCDSGYCVDSVCCENGCTSTCQACSNAKKGAGEDGKCEPIASGRDPDEECATDAASTCNFNGSCNGAGGCALYAQGTACGSTQCNGNTVVGQVCDGLGGCVFDPNGTDCAPYACNDLFGSCNTSCTASSECATGDYFCDAGACKQKQVGGEACTEDAACVSGHCVDGVCCDSECTGQCEACDVTGSEGTCSAIAAADAPHGSRQACAGQGSECAGSCDGAQSACVYPGSETLCDSSSCNGNVLMAVRCDGQGACVADQAKDCGSYACDAAAVDCKSSCSSDDDCSPGSVCDTASGQCGVNTASCKDDYTVIEADGTETGCDPYACRGGGCLSSCTTTEDCVPGYLCNEGLTCVPEAKASASNEEESGCGCRAAGRQGTGSVAWLALALASLACRSRRRVR